MIQCLLVTCCKLLRYIGIIIQSTIPSDRVNCNIYENYLVEIPGVFMEVRFIESCRHTDTTYINNIMFRMAKPLRNRPWSFNNMLQQSHREL